jgi:hypothetical protein
MTSNRRRAKEGGWAVLALGLLLVLPVVYVLSVGPAAYVMADPTWSAVYAPIFWLCDRCWPIDRVLQWSLRAWGLRLN